ncbi:DUF3906 family protein [Bacillus methanolicus]|uniref:DUF3906 domain-containing protein n=1 Tax=Bacillus methanolicus (strain MGA3 / ATCC 53907) TaxID=796606 RepID=I3E355_BACMM|nr:DUF3906 family protein [Bacillus methanolicus]AIE58979.1 hypothetical protein BMMGA3_02575 [Bacillus methanolicus MGA3]EIJ80926.1 hypothetical protein MGA3_11545 [Bacillus methanolicus MGA3]UQD51071.1 DUF3906 family protein [Bacillus methanolicus]
MNLYRFEVTLKGNEVIHVVIAAENDEDAFRLVDVEIEKHFLKLPEIQDISLYEKKKIRKGNGFVLSRLETA